MTANSPDFLPTVLAAMESMEMRMRAHQEAFDAKFAPFAKRMLEQTRTEVTRIADERIRAALDLALQPAPGPALDPEARAAVVTPGAPSGAAVSWSRG